MAVLRIFIKSFGTKDRPGGGSIFGDTVIEVNGINHRKRVSILVFVLCYLVRLSQLKLLSLMRLVLVSLVHFDREFPFIPSLARRAGESEKHRLALFKP